MERDKITSLLQTATGRHSISNLKKTREQAVAFNNKIEKTDAILTDILTAKNEQLLKPIREERQSLKEMQQE